MENMLYLMTRMLYNAPMLKRPNMPEEVVFGSKQFSLRRDLRVNHWLLLAILFGAANCFLFHSNVFPGHLREIYQGWPVFLRLLIEFLPLFAGLLWIWSLARWLRGMDELGRRITLEAWLFASVLTIGFLSFWPLLDAAGLSTSILQTTRSVHLDALDRPILPVTLGMMWFFHLLGHLFFSRRYK
jgi:hypothetical protein